MNLMKWLYVERAQDTKNELTDDERVAGKEIKEKWSHCNWLQQLVHRKIPCQI